MYYFLFLQSDGDDDDIDKDLTPSTSDNPKFVIDSEEEEEEEDDDGDKENDDDGNLTESYDIEEEGKRCEMYKKSLEHHEKRCTSVKSRTVIMLLSQTNTPWQLI